MTAWALWFFLKTILYLIGMEILTLIVQREDMERSHGYVLPVHFYRIQVWKVGIPLHIVLTVLFEVLGLLTKA